jgi:hypothetical protein
MAQQEFRESVSNSEEIGANVLATPQQIAARPLPARSERESASTRRLVTGSPAVPHRDDPL